MHVVENCLMLLPYTLHVKFVREKSPLCSYFWHRPGYIAYSPMITEPEVHIIVSV